MSSGSTQEAAAAAAQRFAAAHDALRTDRSVQFDLRPAPPIPKPPEWVHKLGDWIAWAFRPIGRAIAWVYHLLPDAPYARILLWLVLAAIAVLLIWAIVDRIRNGRWRWPRLRRVHSEEAVEGEQEWAPEMAPVRAWLREADALAADGHFAEAVHHLLIRSIEDIGRRRPRLVRPALTSRDIAAADEMPPTARDIFAGIARIVERSLFGGRAVEATDWTEARTAYADFALPKVWK